MGSIPINKIGLFTISVLIEIIAIVISMYILIVTNYNKQTYIITFFLCIIGVLFYKVTYAKYRNYDARHKYEKETKTTIKITSRT